MPTLSGFIAFVILIVLMYCFRVRLNASGKMLEKSFATRVALVNGLAVPTSALTVLHRWQSNASYGRQGDLMQIDANWLCRTADGHYVVGIAQGMRNRGQWVPRVDKSQPIQITWIWRTLSEAQVRDMLAGQPRVYRRLFGDSR